MLDGGEESEVTGGKSEVLSGVRSEDGYFVSKLRCKGGANYLMSMSLTGSEM